MPNQKKITFEITPQTAVRSNQSDRIFFRIPKEKLHPAGLKRRLRLERYNEYKSSLLAIALSKKFTPPEQGGHIIFYLPIPKSWKEYKKREMHNQLHTQTPDWDNLAKAFFDGLLIQDKGIADVRITKKWTNTPEGRIEVIFAPKLFASPDTIQ
jgi:Holliday junction resolvase RusA-like endonuclease